MYGHGFTFDSLLDKVADNTTVVQRHARAVRVEDARHADGHLVLAVVVERQPSAPSTIPPQTPQRR
jgi:hypothetical protein